MATVIPVDDLITIEAVQRSRNIKQWTNQTNYPNIEAFQESELASGLNTIVHKKQVLDLLIDDRGSDTTIVVFHSALTPRMVRYPVFQGRGMAASVEANLISLADPTIALGDIDLAWFLGNRFIGELPPLLSPLVTSALEKLGTKRTILMGSSGGGYAAVLYGHYFPDSIVLAVNPRLDLTAPPMAPIGKYLTVGHNAVGRTPRQRIRKSFVTDKLLEQYSDGLNFDLCILQNLGDQNYLNHQVIPFVSALSKESRLYTRVEWVGPGHVPFEKEILNNILKQLGSSDSSVSAIQRAGFLATRSEGYTN